MRFQNTIEDQDLCQQQAVLDYLSKEMLTILEHQNFFSIAQLPTMTPILQCFGTTKRISIS